VLARVHEFLVLTHTFLFHNRNSNAAQMTDYRRRLWLKEHARVHEFLILAHTFIQQWRLRTLLLLLLSPENKTTHR